MRAQLLEAELVRVQRDTVQNEERIRLERTRRHLEHQRRREERHAQRRLEKQRVEEEQRAAQHLRTQEQIEVEDTQRARYDEITKRSIIF